MPARLGWLSMAIGDDPVGFGAEFERCFTGSGSNGVLKMVPWVRSPREGEE